MQIRLPSGETLRQAGHIGAGLGALLIRPLGPGPILALVLVALLFNAFVLPRWLGRYLRRPGETGILWGPTAYATAVALLLVVFWRKPELAAAGWLLLAVGDGAATMVGRRWGKRKLPDQTVRVAAVLTVGAVAAALSAAAVESLRLPLDDNLLPPFVGILVLGGLAESRMYDPDLLAGEALERLPAALLVHLLLGWSAWRFGAVTRGAAAVGALLGFLFAWALGWPGWLMFAVLPAVGFAATMVGSESKRSRAIAEGRRHAGQILAKGGVATVAALLAGAGASAPWLTAAAAALAAALADTLASELGVLSRGRPWLLTRWRRVAPGTPGAVSLMGTSAATAGACVPAALGLLAGLLTPAAAAIAAFAGFAATLFESLVVGRLASRPDPVAMNFLSTVVAALLGLFGSLPL